jgi:hypothetical protein
MSVKNQTLYDYEENRKKQAAKLVTDVRKMEVKVPESRPEILCNYSVDGVCRISREKPRANGRIIPEPCNGRWWGTCDVKMKEDHKNE